MLDNPGYVAETVGWNTLRVFDLARDDSLKNDWLINLQALGVDRLISPIDPGSLYLLMALALVGAVAQCGLLRSPRAPPFIWSFPLLMVLPAVTVWGLQRYRAPVDPFLVMLAAVGIVAAFEAVARRVKSSPARRHRREAGVEVAP